MDFNFILQFILSLINKVTDNNSEQNQTSVSIKPSINTIFIKRGAEESSGIYGRGSLSWDSFIFEALENDQLEIPVGTFKLQWHKSVHLNGEVVPELVAVPGRDSILIHEGNFETDSRGCILVGSVRDGNAIDNSKTTLATLKEKINEVGIENCQIIIS